MGQGRRLRILRSPESVMVFTVKRGKTVPGEERENRGRTERGKGGSLTVKVHWEAIIQTAQGESREERSKKLSMRRSHRVTPEGMAQVKVSEERRCGS